MKVKKELAKQLFNRRMIVYMRYVNQIGMIPSSYGIQFIDIDSSYPIEFGDCDIVRWFNEQALYHVDSVYQVMEEFKPVYSIAYKKIMEFIHNKEYYSDVRLSRKEIFNIRLISYMKYLTFHEVLSKKDRLKFHDIDAYYVLKNDSVTVSDWFYRMLMDHLDEVVSKMEMLKNDYPVGYAKLKILIDERQNKSFSHLDRMGYLVRYLECRENSIPHARSGLRFCDIDSTCNDKALVGVWIQGFIRKNFEKFVDLLLVYENEFPIGVGRLQYKLERKNKDAFSFYRISVIVNYLQNSFFTDEHSFSDIGGSNYDTSNVWDWILVQRSHNSDTFFGQINEYCENHQIDVNVIIDNLNYSMKNCFKRDSKRKVRDELFFRYLESNDVISHGNRLCFHDIDENVLDFGNVFWWFYRKYILNVDYCLCKINEYRDKYPVACLKLKKRLNKSEYYKKSRQFSYEVKVRCALQYLDSHPVPHFHDTISFRNIDSTVEYDGSFVRWFYNEVCHHMSILEDVSRKYQSIYPNGYLALVNFINHSNVRLNKQRKVLVTELKQLSMMVGMNDENELVGNCLTRKKC